MNNAVLIGRLTADPELKHTQNGNAVTGFSIAVDRPYQKAGEERQADFIDIVAWRGTAEFICKYFKKGRKIAVQGAIQTRSYTDKDGNKRKAFEIVADNVHFADSKRDTSAPAMGGGMYQQPTARPEVASAPAPAYTSGDTGDFEEILNDDDLPF